MKGFKKYVAAAAVLAALTLWNPARVFSQYKDTVPKTAQQQPVSQKTIVAQAKTILLASKINFDSIAAIYDTPEKAYAFAHDYLVLDTAAGIMRIETSQPGSVEHGCVLNGRKDSVAVAFLKKAFADEKITGVTGNDIAVILSMQNGEVKKKNFNDSIYNFEMKNGKLTWIQEQAIQKTYSFIIQSIPSILQGKKGSCTQYAALIAAILQKNGYKTYLLGFANHTIVAYLGKNGLWGTSGVNPQDVQKPQFASVNEAFKNMDKTIYAQSPKVDVYACQLPQEAFDKEGTIYVPSVCLMKSSAGQGGKVVYTDVFIAK